MFLALTIRANFSKDMIVELRAFQASTSQYLRQVHRIPRSKYFNQLCAKSRTFSLSHSLCSARKAKPKARIPVKASVDTGSKTIPKIPSKLSTQQPSLEPRKSVFDPKRLIESARTPEELILALSRNETPVEIYKAPSQRSLYAAALTASFFMFGSGLGIYYYGNWGVPEELYNRAAGVSCSLAGGIFLFMGVYFAQPTLKNIKTITVVPKLLGGRQVLDLKVSVKASPIARVWSSTYDPRQLKLSTPVSLLTEQSRRFEYLRTKAKLTIGQKLQMRLFLSPIYKMRMVLFKEGFVKLKLGDDLVGKIDTRGALVDNGRSKSNIVGFLEIGF